MGIIRATLGAAESVFNEQWLEAFFCDSLSSETLIARGVKRTGARSTNTRADDNVITNGSILSVADGQCVIVTAQGKVVDVCGEAGEHRFFDPNHTGGVDGYLRDVWTRVGFGGGDVQPIRHRIYYVNTKECLGVRFDTPAPFPLSVTDENIGAKLDLSVEAGGVYSYRVKDPVTLYRKVVGNIEDAFQRRTLNGMLTAALLNALPEVLAALTENGIRPYELAMHTTALRDALTERLKEPFLEQYGLEIVSIAFDTLIVTDLAMLTAMQAAAINKDPAMAAATTVDAVAGIAKKLGQ